jgi:predicted esterase
MVPFVPEEPPDLSGKSVYLGAALHDPIVAPEETMRVERLFRDCGADVLLQWQPHGHGLTPKEVPAVRDWLGRWMERNGRLPIPP